MYEFLILCPSTDHDFCSCNFQIEVSHVLPITSEVWDKVQRLARGFSLLEAPSTSSIWDPLEPQPEHACLQAIVEDLAVAAGLAVDLVAPAPVAAAVAAGLLVDLAAALAAERCCRSHCSWKPSIVLL